MSLTLKSRQYASFIALVSATVIAATLGYRHAREEWVYFRKAEDLFLSGKYSYAIPLYNQAIQRGIRNPRALSRLGNAYLANHDLEDALKVFRDLFELEPDNRYVFLNLAGIYDMMGRTDEAIKLYSESESLWSSDPLSIARLAELYLSKKDFIKAESLYRRALELAPNFYTARYKLARLLGWMNRYEESISLYRTILARYPENRSLRLSFAKVLGWDNRFEEAIHEYRKALGEEQ